MNLFYLFDSFWSIYLKSVNIDLFVRFPGFDSVFEFSHDLLLELGGIGHIDDN